MVKKSEETAAARASEEDEDAASPVPEIAPGPAPGAMTFRVTLKANHAEWLQGAAAMQKVSPERLLQAIVAEAYAKDPTKGGRAGLRVADKGVTGATTTPRP